MTKIALLPGDGVGPEIVAQARAVLEAVTSRYGLEIEYVTGLVGGAALDACGQPLPPETLALCAGADAILLGAVGGPRWDHLPGRLRPEQAILGLRRHYGLFANIRPVRVLPALYASCPLKPERLAGGIDLVIVRELTGGVYFGARRRFEQDGAAAAEDTECYNAAEIARIMHVACRAAQGRRRRVVSVDKANVLETSRLWRQVAAETAAAYAGVSLSHMYVDNCAMQLVLNPGQFDVIVTSNLFGDILSDEAAVLAGSIGMLPSASLRGADNFGLYEPIHGSAPDIAGQDKANPLGAILSAAMLLRYSLQREDAARAVEDAVERVLDAGWRTTDLAAGGTALGTAAMGARVAAAVR